VKTDDLIVCLAERISPVGPRYVLWPLVLGLLGGMAVSFIVMITWLGLRPDLSNAIATAPFWIKFIYTLVILVAGFRIVERQARAGFEAPTALTIGGVALAAIIGLAVIQLTTSGTPSHVLIMGHSAKVCTRNIILLSAPVFVGVFLALRQLAPTRLTFAGAGAGLLAGATGAWVYAFHCNESAIPFLGLWYTLGIGATAFFGAGLGRWALRW